MFTSCRGDNKNNNHSSILKTEDEMERNFQIKDSEWAIRISEIGKFK
jgi:hypothetical protein